MTDQTKSAPDTAEGRLTDLIDRWKIDTYPAADLMPSADAMPAFLADLDTVLRDLRQERNGHIGTMQERDHATEAADRLAYAIAPVEVIGEHSSGNDPWTNALDVLQERPDLTRKALNEATALNGVHERVIARLRADLEHAKAAPGPSGLTRVWSGYDGTGERRDFNTDGEFESVERCGGCDGTGRVAIEADAESGSAR